MLIDSHCHFDFSAFDEQRETLWQQCQVNDICALVMPGIEPQQWPSLLDISRQLEGIYYAVGLHPWWLEKSGLSPLELKHFLSNWLVQHNESPLVALGECGLDAKQPLALEDQAAFLDVHLALAKDYELPIILHCYKAHNLLLERLKFYKPLCGGVIHGFSGSLDLALQYWRMGIHIGVGGTITYPRANKTRNAVAQLPLDALLLETDAPDMPLQGYQGQANSPLKVINVAGCLAELRQESLDLISKQTSQNSRALFGLLK